MKNRITQRKAGVILSYASEGVQILTGILYTPIMLRLLGQSEYGLYQLVYSVVSYLGLFSLGFGSSYMRFYSRYKAKNDKVEIDRLNGMFLTIFLIISLISILCGSVLIINIETVLGGGLTNSELSTARVLMILMVFSMALSFPASIFNSWVTAHERFVFQKTLQLAQKIMNPFITLPLLIMGVGSIGMVLVTTCLTIASFLVNVYFCCTKLKISFLFKDFKLSMLKEMWAFTFFIFLNQIIDQINWNLDKYLLGSMVDTTAVAIYSLGGQINTMYMQFSTSVSNVFVTKVNKIVAESNDNEELTRLFTQIGRVQMLILGLVLSGFVIFGRPFMIFWGGQGYEESYQVALLLIIPATIPLIQNLGLEIQRAKNMHKARSVVYLGVILVNIGLSIKMIRLWGVSGAAIGTALSIILGTIIFMNWYYHFKIGLNIVYFWKNILKLFPAFAICAVVGILLRKFITISSLIPLLICICVYSLIYIVVMWLIGMNQDEKNMVKGMLRR